MEMLFTKKILKKKPFEKSNWKSIQFEVKTKRRRQSFYARACELYNDISIRGKELRWIKKRRTLL